LYYFQFLSDINDADTMTDLIFGVAALAAVVVAADALVVAVVVAAMAFLAVP
jgi:hypothetical protein